MDLVQVLSRRYSLFEDTVREIRNGAMVILSDNGHFYDSHQGLARCWSEHSSTAPVYDIEAQSVGTILVGLCVDGSSWVQWERSICCSYRHLRDWWWYKWTGKNQGPFGESSRTESNPIRLQADPIRVPDLYL